MDSDQDRENSLNTTDQTERAALDPQGGPPASEAPGPVPGGEPVDQGAAQPVAQPLQGGDKAAAKAGSKARSKRTPGRVEAAPVAPASDKAACSKGKGVKNKGVKNKGAKNEGAINKAASDKDAKNKGGEARGKRTISRRKSSPLVLGAININGTKTDTAKAEDDGQSKKTGDNPTTPEPQTALKAAGPDNDEGDNPNAIRGEGVRAEADTGNVPPLRLTLEEAVGVFRNSVEGDLNRYFASYLDHPMRVAAKVAEVGQRLFEGFDEGKVAFKSADKVRNRAWSIARRLRLHLDRDNDPKLIPRASHTRSDKAINSENFSYSNLRNGYVEPLLADTPEDTALKREALRHAMARFEAKVRLVKLLNPDDVRKFFEPITAKPGTKAYHAQIVARGRALRRMKLHLAMMGIRNRRDLDAYLDEQLGLF